MPKGNARTSMAMFGQTTSGNTSKRLATVFDGRLGERKRFIFYFMLFYTLWIFKEVVLTI